MEARVMNKKRVIISVVVLLVLVVIVFVVKKCSFENENIEVVQDDVEDYMTYDDNWWKIGYEVARKNGHWEDLPLSKKFKEKYNEKDGILGDVEYDDIEYAPSWVYGLDDRFENNLKLFVITQGKSKTAYAYIVLGDDDGLVDDVLIEEKQLLYDEEGNYVPVPKDTFYTLGTYFYFGKLGHGYDEEKSIAVTEKFHKKYPHFIDLFIHYSPAGYNIFSLIEEKSDYRNNMIYVEIDSILEKIKREYKVYYEIDEDGWLDDARSELLGEYPYEKSYYNIDWAIKRDAAILYRNSNWDDIWITDNFRNKFNPKDGIFPDPELYNYYNDEITYLGEKPKDSYSRKQQILPDGWRLNAYLLLDGHYHYYVKKSIHKEIGGLDYVDDVLWEKLPYMDMDSKEVKKLYLESKGISEDNK